MRDSTTVTRVEKDKEAGHCVGFFFSAIQALRLNWVFRFNRKLSSTNELA